MDEQIDRQKNRQINITQKSIKDYRKKKSQFTYIFFRDFSDQFDFI